MEVLCSLSSSPLAVYSRWHHGFHQPPARFNFHIRSRCPVSSSPRRLVYVPRVSCREQLFRPLRRKVRDCKRRFSISAAFERFTERAVKAVVFSQKEAKSFGEDMVSPQHLLLGLILEDRDPNGFLGSGIKIDQAREVVKSIWYKTDGGAATSTSPTDTTFSSSSKRVFEAAVEYSRALGYKFISPEHIAIGLFTVDDGSAAQVLTRFGVDSTHLAAIAVARLQGELAKDGRELSADPNVLEKNPSFKKTKIPTFIHKNKEKSALAQFCVDLTARASDGAIDPVIGRDVEIKRMVQILCRRTKNNPILLGESGVGKTAIAEGLANFIARAEVPFFLLSKRVMSLDVGLLIAGAKERGELESRVTSLIKETVEAGNIILFIDEVHTIVGTGTVGRGIKGSGFDIANLLKPALGRGELQCIASTTIDEFRMCIESDKALARRFQPMLINEPNQEDAVTILLGLRQKYETYHRCKFTFEALHAAVSLSARYIADRHLPDKAIDLIDEAGSRARMQAYRKKKEELTGILSKSPDDYWQEIKTVQAMHNAIVASHVDKDISVSLSNDSGELVLETPLVAPLEDDEPVIVTHEDIAEVASLWSGIPVQQLTADERMFLVGLEEQLRKRVIGQDEGVAAISRAVKRSRVGLKDPKRPIATMLFCGPTGVGKTELTKALAACFFGSESSMIRLDMSEYMESHTVSKLIGAPPGYVGYGEGGTLTEAARKRPFSVILLDEIEKAHPNVFNILLQLFEDGHLTDSQGRRVSFKNTLIVMTSNIGSAAIAKGSSAPMGFLTQNMESNSYAGMKSIVMEELKGYFRPELLNRLDEVVVFRSLNKNQMQAILNIMLQEVKSRLISLDITLEVSNQVKNLICQEGYDEAYGARPLRRAVIRIIEDPLSEAILSGDLNAGDTAIVDLDSSGSPVIISSSSSMPQMPDQSATVL